MPNRVEIPFVVETFVEDEAKQRVATPVLGASVTIINRETSAAAKVYAEETGAGPISSPVTEESGQIPGWLEEGPYTITVTGGTPTIATTKYAFDAVSGRGVEKVAAGTIDYNDLVIAVRELLVPTGVVLPYVGLVAPTGYLLTDGKKYKVATYPSLSTVLNFRFGGSSESGEFAVPDTRGRSLVGMGLGPGLLERLMAAKYGEEGVTLTAAQSGLREHKHGFESKNVAINPSLLSATGSAQEVPVGTLNETGGAVGGAKAAEASHNNLQPSIVANMIIKT